MQSFDPPPRTRHGQSSTEQLPDVLDRLGADDVVVVTDRGVREAGVVAKVTDHVHGSPSVYDGVTPNPSVDTVVAAREAVGDADAVVADGGGSVVDTAKAACALPAFRDSFAVLRDASPDERPPRPGADVPLVALPTTAGTGTETGQWAVISDHDVDRKVSAGHPALRADAVVLDPELTRSLPPYVTAATGFDVVTHALEALTATNASAFTRPDSQYAYRLADRHLLRAVDDGENVDARERMLEASYLAGLAMNNAGLGAVHGISHAIGGLYDTPHGHTNAVLLPHVVRANARRSSDAASEYAALVDEHGDPGELLATRLEALRERAGLDRELPGAPDEWNWSAVADRAVGNVNTKTNPVTFSRDEVVDLCERAFERR